MSTTVKYKGSTLATVTNQTKTLLTSGTWLEDDIELTDAGSGGADMPTFTLDNSMTSVTCDKTFAECMAYVNNDVIAALVDTPYGLMTAYNTDGSATQLRYVISDPVPEVDIVYNSAGTLNLVMPSTYRETLSVTQNGTYYPSQQNKAITEVTVNVPGGGGATNFVQGTFTTNASSGVQNVTISYTGTGYPIAAIIYPKDGLANSPVASAIKRYAIVQWSFTKILADTPPTYTTGDANYGLTLLCFKNSTSNSTSYSQASSRQGNVFYTTDPTANQSTVVKFSNATTLRFFVAASSYGLFPSTEYSYIIVYSS